VEAERSNEAGERPSVEDYVKTLAARVNLPASTIKAAVRS
jgi:hypothetical protein